MRDTSIKVGDRVEIVHHYSDDASRHDGADGTVLELDRLDDVYPYEVELGDGRVLWVAEVRKNGAEPAAPTRSDYVTQAKAALVGTQHDAADIIELAKFLAGE